MRSRQDKGIVLLEVLLAFSILAVSLTVLMQVVGANVNRQKSLENRLMAATHASNLIAELGITAPLEDLQQSGHFDERFSWSIEVNEITSLIRDRSTEQRTLGLASLALTIKWQEGATKKNYAVNTKRMVWH